MKSIVVDACVAIKWFIPEIHSIEAIRLLDKNVKLIAPDLIFAEVGNILWKKCRQQQLSVEIASEMLEDFKNLPIDHYESELILDTAWLIATSHNCTVYDSLYVALAQIEKCLLVTADRVLYNNLNVTDLGGNLIWVEDIPVSSGF